MTEIEPIRAKVALASYVDIVRAIAELDAAEGFVEPPTLVASGVKGGRVWLDRLGFSSASTFALLKPQLAAWLENERCQVYKLLTGAYRIPGAEIRRIVRDRLDVETAEADGAFESWAGNAPPPRSEAEKAIFDEEDADLEIPAFLKGDGA